MLAGLYFFFKKKLGTLALLCGVAFAFKYFSLFLFVPRAAAGGEANSNDPDTCPAPRLADIGGDAAVPMAPAFRTGVRGFSVTSYVFQAAWPEDVAPR